MCLLYIFVICYFFYFHPPFPFRLHFSLFKIKFRVYFNDERKEYFREESGCNFPDVGKWINLKIGDSDFSDESILTVKATTLSIWKSLRMSTMLQEMKIGLIRSISRITNGNILRIPQRRNFSKLKLRGRTTCLVINAIIVKQKTAIFGNVHDAMK